MANDFLKKYYIQILDKAKKDIHDCRVVNCLTIDNTFYGDKPFYEIRLSLKFKNNKIIKECNSVLEIAS